MSALNNNMKIELANALDDKNETMFVLDGKLVSLEVHDTTSVNEESDCISCSVQSYKS